MTFSFNVGGITPQDAQNQGQGDNAITQTLSPKNIAGLICYLDGEINSRAGVRDTAVNGMQNLVYNPMKIATSTSTGTIEILNGTPTFTAKGCKLGGTSFIPAYILNDLTVEYVIEFDSDAVKDQVICNSLISTDTGGIQVFMNINRLYYQACYPTKYIHADFPFELGKKYYIAVTDTINKSGATKMYVNGIEVQTTIRNDGVGSPTLSQTINMGIGGLASTSTTSTFKAENLIFYKFRIWNRQLSAEEIKNNYNADVKALA